MSQKIRQPSQNRISRIAVNLMGILSAFGIAFGGLFLVQSRLSLEQEKLLQGGGMAELPQTVTTEVSESIAVSLQDSLTEEELLQLVHNLEQKEEIQPHEPLEGQLTMVQAINCSEAWLKEFLLSGFAVSDFPAREYRVSCWTVSLSDQNIDASLTLNAVSGQVLDASVSCSASVFSPDSEDLLTLLEKYAASFGLEGDDILISIEDKDTIAKELLCYQSIGTRGIYAAIQTGNIIFASTGSDTKTPIYMERFNVHLYLSSEPKIRFSETIP